MRIEPGQKTSIDEILRYFNEDEIKYVKTGDTQDLHIYIELIHRPNEFINNFDLVLPEILAMEEYYWETLEFLHKAGFMDMFIEGPSSSEKASKINQYNLEEYAEVCEAVKLFQNANLPKETINGLIKEQGVESGAFYFFFAASKPDFSLWTAESSKTREEIEKLYQQKDELVVHGQPYFERGIEITHDISLHRRKLLEELKTINENISAKHKERGEAAVRNLIQAVNTYDISRSILFFGMNHEPDITTMYKNSSIPYAIIQPREVRKTDLKLCEVLENNKR